MVVANKLFPEVCGVGLEKIYHQTLTKTVYQTNHSVVLSTITGLDWWTILKIVFMLSNENSNVGLHLETQPLSLTDSSDN